MNENTTAVRDLIYPMVEKALSTSKGKNQYKKFVNDFFAKRDTEVYDALPCSRIICSEDEMDQLFVALNINKTDVEAAIKETFFAQVKNFNPKAALHAFTLTQLCVVRYYHLMNSRQDRDLSILLLAFSGKFYPSLHYKSYPTVMPVRHVMEYVVNNKLSQKYDLASQGSIMGAVKSITNTWITTYNSKFKTFTDLDIKSLIEQLRSRLGSFMRNIASEYYKAYDDKDIYMSYSSDSFEQDDYHLADNDTLKVEKITEAVATSIASNGVDYKLCKACSDENITPNEAKAVIESIVMDRDNILSIKELVSLMITTYFAVAKNKDVTDIEFITYTISPKPNAKQPEILRQKELVENFLSDSGTAYLRRRSRISTRNSYERCVKMYFALLIHNVARRK